MPECYVVSTFGYLVLQILSIVISMFYIAHDMWSSTQVQLYIQLCGKKLTLFKKSMEFLLHRKMVGAWLFYCELASHRNWWSSVEYPFRWLYNIFNPRTQKWAFNSFTALFNRIAIKTFSDSSNFECLLSHSAYILSMIGLDCCPFFDGAILLRNSKDSNKETRNSQDTCSKCLVLPTLHPKKEEKSGYRNFAICSVLDDKPRRWLQLEKFPRPWEHEHLFRVDLLSTKPVWLLPTPKTTIFSFFLSLLYIQWESQAM
jgi:hypothetical protein